ncbi:four-carbon acid sugar kinase family protein [Roseicitreum antarcticum]|uniref:four-carbon acid sugar kinase family protein n=1 Tax=Roseicitreum antarcticum TaxID=564137 RepID=UPI001CC20DEC|nr:four-carbon acid sugar kinase family protein [Roseicitreum antarcticum]
MLIIADDLTGTLDAAVAFARAGHRVCAARKIATLPACIASGAEVIAVNTASREINESAARANLHEIAAMLDLHRIPVLIKKVDSRLKGHPGPEARELADLAGRAECLAAPALPRMGRFQVAGQLMGQGILTPISIAARLGTKAHCPDIQTAQDLETAVAKWGLASNTLWIGASDLAFALARATYAQPLPEPTPLVGRIAVVIGSRDPITLAQLEDLAQNGAVIHRAPNGWVPACDTDTDPFLLAIAPGNAPCPAAKASMRFADGALDAVSKAQPRTIICAGGETADALLARLGVDMLDLKGEIAPGLPICQANLPWGSVDIITKSGGFGGPQILTQLALQRHLSENNGLIS